MRASICSFTYYSLPCIYKYIIIFTENRGGNGKLWLIDYPVQKHLKLVFHFCDENQLNYIPFLSMKSKQRDNTSIVVFINFNFDWLSWGWNCNFFLHCTISHPSSCPPIAHAPLIQYNIPTLQLPTVPSCS